jgi:hypothetical protein
MVGMAPPLAVARDAWARLGPDYLAGEPDGGAWALREFGRPSAAEQFDKETSK